MKQRHKTAIISCLLIWVFIAFPAHAILINGGFEQPAIAPGTAEDRSEIAGWTLRSDDRGTIHRDFAAAEGQQFLELNSVEFGDIFQQTSLVAGIQYQFDFYYSLPLLPNGRGIPEHANSDAAGSFGFALEYLSSSRRAEVFAPLVLGPVYKIREPDWQSYSYKFTAKADSITATFFDMDKSGYLIDGVSLTAVPEPATVLLLGLGLAALAGVGRRTPAR